MAVLTTGNTFSNGDQVTAGSLNNAVNDAEFADGAVDGISTQKSGSGAIIVKDLGISSGKIAIDAVGTDQLANDVVISTSGSITGAAGAFTTLSASGDISVDGSVKQSGNTGNLTLKGGDTDGANIELYGSNHATVSIRNNAYYDAGVHVFRPVDGSSSSVVINSDGEVGIGTTSPSYLLDVSPTSNGGEIARFKSDTINAAADVLIVDQDNSNTRAALQVQGNAGSTECLFVGSNGNVGIGTESPAKLLHVKSPNSDTAESVAQFGNGDIDGGLEIKTNGNGGSSLDWGFNAVNSRNLVFDTNQNERMRITSTGNVGIGDNDPSKELVVKQISSAASESIINIIAGNAGVAGIYLGDSDDDIVAGIVYDNSADTLQLRSSNNQTAVTINSLEQVGIGTTTPSHKLDVNSGATNQVALFESTDETAYIELADNTGSVQFITYSSGDLRIATGGAGAGSVGTSALFIDQSQNVGIGDDTPSFKLDVNGTGRFVGDLTLDDEVLHNISGTQTRQPGYFAGTYGAEIEQTAQGSTIHIGRSDGNCMNVGADATAAGTDVNVVYFRDTGAGSPVANEVGKIIIDTTSTNYETSSDYRLKENEVDITDGIDRLKELKPYRFNFTRNPSKVVDGFFAHEVSPVVPESISGEKDQVDDEGNPVYQGIDQSKLVPLLTAALQEAVAKIEALEARVQTLEG